MQHLKSIAVQGNSTGKGPNQKNMQCVWKWNIVRSLVFLWLSRRIEQKSKVTVRILSVLNRFVSCPLLNIFPCSNSKLCCICPFILNSSTIIFGNRKNIDYKYIKYHNNLSSLSGMLPTQPKQTSCVVKMAFLRLLKHFC